VASTTALAGNWKGSLVREWTPSTPTARPPDIRTRVIRVFQTNWIRSVCKQAR
jgi:hypothetical protein